MIRRVFAQLFGFRYCCPNCGHLNTILKGRRVQWNRVTGLTTCAKCRKVYIAGLILWESAGGRRSARPDQTPTPRELAMIRGEVEETFEQDDRTGRFVPKKLKAGERVNRYISVDRELKSDTE
jgi:hypothetical protein